jgi:UDP-4-amino-4,6-dideoxy-N-acetyl-beta-L-altrosamine transaminase
MIPYGKQLIDEEDITAVISVLRSDFLTQGPKVTEFEKTICDYTGAKYCVAVANGTAALHIATAALQIKPGYEGITSPITFVASSNCMVYNGIKPQFADINAITYNIDPEKIKRKITEKTKLLIPVHFAGQLCDMKTIHQIAIKNNLFVIEDAAHAIGSRYEDGTPVGNCKYSDMTIFSFHPVKTITTGEGGAVTTNNPELYQKLLLLRSHGITKDPAILSSNPGPWYYEMKIEGFNYRMCDMQAALGVSQMRKLDMFATRRREIVAKYNNAFRGIDKIKTPYENPDVLSCFHLYVLQFDFDKVEMTRPELMKALANKGVGSQVHYIPVHTQPFYKEQFGYSWGDYPIAEAYYNSALSLPLYASMSDEDVNEVITAVVEICK